MQLYIEDGKYYVLGGKGNIIPITNHTYKIFNKLAEIGTRPIMLTADKEMCKIFQIDTGGYKYPSINLDGKELNKELPHVYSYMNAENKHIPKGERFKLKPHISISVEDIIDRNGGFHSSILIDTNIYTISYHMYFMTVEDDINRPPKLKIKSMRITLLFNDKQIHFETIYAPNELELFSPKNSIELLNYFYDNIINLFQGPKFKKIKLTSDGKLIIKNMLKKLLSEGIKFYYSLLYVILI